MAKLYSQYTRLKMNQPGLKGWRDNEFSERLADAVTLIDAGLTEREIGEKEWRDFLNRSGELLEWLSHPELNTQLFPLRLLSAGLYQLAGYPALSMGLLNSEHAHSNDSKILLALLKADFPKLLTLIIDYWRKEMSDLRNRNGTFRQIDVSDVNSRLIDEIVKALGLLCMYMRWGDTKRLEQAQQKLRDLSGIMIYGTDSYSWLLSKIVSEVVHEYISSSMRFYVQKLQKGVSNDGKKAFERYLRSNYRARKSLAWHSQAHGIERLLQDGSFALCTPTGSGKTTIAELAIIQSIFLKEDDILLGVAPIVMYLVPSRALASEVEKKLGVVLGNLGRYSVKVTGLYGGIDWGPTDAWVTSSEPTVLICTYEKGEALIRFLGPLFLNRVSLVVIDEAHSVQFNGNYENLRNADDRSLRLELLANRLLRYVSDKRVIALSAVAENTHSLAHWVSGSDMAEPVVSTYRSTRQLIGRLEWSQSGQYEIRYDILNGHDLHFSDDGGKKDVPYIQKPFTTFPIPYLSIPKMFINEKNGVSKRQRPYLFWAAMQLAQPDEHGIRHSVLISVTQHANGYAEDFLYVLNTLLPGEQIPDFFSKPSDPKDQILLEKCLQACGDYFGPNSNEYLLLQKGIVVHHGNMPGLLARLSIELIQKQIVHIALATSTLSEGVNLPFETVIIPTLLRNRDLLSVSEFKNLVGRAGRPGSGTEGRTLIFLEGRPNNHNSRSAHKNYFQIIKLLTQVQSAEEATKPLSPLGALMSHMASAWMQISGSNSETEFITWLEKTVPLDDSVNESDLSAEESLDTLDGYLLTLLVEQELINGQEMNSSKLEDFLIDVWKKTYTKYVMSRIDIWERAFTTRGKAVHEKLYPDPELRRRLYKTSVAPRYGRKILNAYRVIHEHMLTGKNYPEWSDEKQIQFIIETVELVSGLGKFEISNKMGKSAVKRSEILTWWLNPTRANKSPTNKQSSDWIKFIKKEFEYKFNWGLGTVLALILDDVNKGALLETRIEDWPNTGLPWIVFWLKELMSWGTLDPVASMLLAHGVEHTRSAAENRAKDYYATYTHIPVDDILNATRIKQWIDQLVEKKTIISDLGSNEITASLTRDFNRVNVSEWRVLPVTIDDSITWIDPAGYQLAVSKTPDNWIEDMESNHDFILDVKLSKVIITSFL